MHKVLKSAALGLLAMTILTIGAGVAAAQEDTTPKKRLNGPTTVSGMIGGEAHDSYVIKARKGQRMSVQITWEKVENNKAEFKVSRSANFYGGEMVRFGQTTYLEDKWNGRIPETGDYYIYVVAHPTANYKLRVSFR
ncbi:MAG: hypothetical protein KA746_07445 [Pyrinomonadaceae bacterium]|nr:hypothetical protein [Pyrinomonadaceae bacterium]MBP6212473.1 hypothetical protein [Pyrinomonadaceae bacterium]